MANKLVMKTAVLKINNTTLTAWDGSDISAYVKSITGNFNIEELDDTTFGAPAKSMAAGLEDNTIQFNVQDADSMSALEGVLWPLRGTKVYVAFRPKNAAVSTDNPEYQFQCLVAGTFPVGGQVGQISEKSFTWRIVSVITRDTTP